MLVLLPLAAGREFFLPGLVPDVQRPAVRPPAVYASGAAAETWEGPQNFVPVYAVPEEEQGADWESRFSFGGMAVLGAGLGLAGSMLSLLSRPSASVPMLQVTGQEQGVSAQGSLRYSGEGRQGRYSQKNVQLVQGGSLRTWTYRSTAVERVQVGLKTEGRPLDADVDLWQGPDNTPLRMRVYVENGKLAPFNCVIETPRGNNTVQVKNIGQLEFPIQATVEHENCDIPSAECLEDSTLIQGGALRTWPMESHVESVEVLLTTDGRPLNARVEMLQGPNNNKHVIELYTEDGLDRPFFCILETPGAGTVVRIVNTAPVEFPMQCSVVPHSINHDLSADPMLGGDVVIGGDVSF
jgi:hypothetical protein